MEMEIGIGVDKDMKRKEDERKKAESENMKMLQGEDIKVEGDDRIHTKEHILEMCGEDYEDYTNETKKRFIAHIKKHMDKMENEMAGKEGEEGNKSIREYVKEANDEASEE